MLPLLDGHRARMFPIFSHFKGEYNEPKDNHAQAIAKFTCSGISVTRLTVDSRTLTATDFNIKSHSVPRTHIVSQVPNLWV